MTEREVLKLALEALSPWAGEDANHTEQYSAYHAIREALANYNPTSDHCMMENAQGELERIKLVQTGVGIGKRAEEAYKAAKERGWVGVSEEIAQPEQETVLPGGGHVPAVPVAVYGYCPECGGAGVMRERRPNGDDKCTNGHKYPSSKALAEQPAQQQEPVAKVVSTAPERIWLDLGFDPEVEDEISFDDLFEATWSHDNATGNGIEYVRADLAPASKPWVGLTEAYYNEVDYADAIEAAHGIKE